MPLSDVHHTKGTHVVYVLRCDPTGTEFPELRYIGKTCDWEKRLSQHCGKSPGGAVFTKAHPPVSIESVHVCKNAEEATFMEVGTWCLLAARHGHQSVRGGRHNMDCGMMKWAPRGWEEEEKSKNSEKSEKSDEEKPTECPMDPNAKKGGVGLSAYFGI